MINGFGFPFNGFGGVINPGAFAVNGQNRRRLKMLCIFELNTTNVVLSEETVDFGIDRCDYFELPNEGYINLRFNHNVPAGGEALPITIVVPNSNNSTNTNNPVGSTANGETKVGVIDHNSDPVVGSDISDETQEVLAYYNKCTGIIRFVNFETGGGAAAAATTGGAAAQ